MNIKLLEKLCLTAGVPGREYRITELIKKEIEGLFDTVTVDPMGSIIAVKNPTTTPGSKTGKKSTKKKSSGGGGPKKVMLAAHMDQIGFLVTFIDDKGFIYVNPVGGFDTRNLFARSVTICPDLKNPKKDITGIMNPAGKPVHIATDEERKKIPEVREMLIDTGMTKAQIEKKVQLGDMVVINAPVIQMGDYMVSQAMDNRIACWVAIEAIRKMKAHACEIHCVFTVQEEVGLRGAVASTHTIQPDIGIGIDITLACDTPGVPEIDHVTKLGDGASIVVMDSSVIADHDLVEDFSALAKKHKIKAQRAIMKRGGTDTGGIQRTSGGCRAITLGVPGRYVHTVTEMCHKSDLTACRDLLAKYLESVN